MTGREVIVLDVVLHDVLPIDVELLLPQVVERHHLLHAVVRELGLVRLHALRHARAAAAEANEHHAHEGLQLDGLETEARAIEFWERVGCADAAVAAVQVISPAVIVAAEKLLATAPLSRNHGVRPMCTDVVESSERPGLVTNDEPTLAKELERDIVARATDFAHVTHDLP